MKKIKSYILLILILSPALLYGQKTSIEFETNGRTQNEITKNPFSKFFGEWTLADDNWTQNWGYGTETIKIPMHHTISREINTDNSLLSIIDGPEPNGHIFWSYNPNTKEVHHLSSFGTIRAGEGKGTVNENGDVRLKLSFEGEPADTYRIYNYKWLNENEYHMKSIQYNDNDEPTGLFYEGNFVRIQPINELTHVNEINKILDILDDNTIAVEDQLIVYAEDIIHMAPNSEVITSKESLKNYLEGQRTYGYSEMEHQIVEIESFQDVILMRGAVTGTFHPESGDPAFEFKTKNLFVFKRINGELKISKVIYNMSPND